MKSIAEIQRRKRHYVDILDKRVDGQNIYYLVGHTRANIFSNNNGISQGKDPVINPAGAQFAQKIVSVPEKHQTRLRTIPNSNLNERKKDVLRIHKENL